MGMKKRFVMLVKMRWLEVLDSWKVGVLDGSGCLLLGEFTGSSIAPESI